MKILLPICAVLSMGVFSGCTADCDSTCKKLISCESEGLDVPLMNKVECNSACNAQLNYYQDNDYTDKENAFKDMRACIVSETCEAISEGVCYDEEVYAW